MMHARPLSDKAEVTMLEFSPDQIQTIARTRLPVPFWKLFLVQARTEFGLKLFKHVNFRKNENDQAVRAYSAMSTREFEGINARQRWANWRTIPKNLSGWLPNHPLHAIDLCCGIGHSTEVLAAYLPAGSRILGLEYNPEFVRQARKRRFLHASGKPMEVSFHAQSVLETFHDGKRRVADASVDLVNSCGAVGNHFTPEATAGLAREIHRVLRPGGLATIDSGLPGTSRSALSRIFAREGFEVNKTAKSVRVDPDTQICFSKRG
jgi:SAM-dependent methyltransferase